jgi:hypothetical protein
VVQVASGRPLIAHALVRFQASICEIRDLQVTDGQGVLRCLRVSPVGIKPPELHAYLYHNATLNRWPSGQNALSDSGQHWTHK